MNTYNDLNMLDKKEFDAILLHAVHSFPTAFVMANEIIELSKKYGIFDNIQIMRQQYQHIETVNKP